VYTDPELSWDATRLPKSGSTARVSDGLQIRPAA
jgi:hypothetical protein